MGKGEVMLRFLIYVAMAPIKNPFVSLSTHVVSAYAIAAPAPAVKAKRAVTPAPRTRKRSLSLSRTLD